MINSMNSMNYESSVYFQPLKDCRSQKKNNYLKLFNSRRRSTMTQERWQPMKPCHCPPTTSTKKLSSTKVSSSVSHADDSCSNSTPVTTCNTFEGVGGTWLIFTNKIFQRINSPHSLWAIEYIYHNRKVKWGQNIFSVYCRHDRFSKNRYLKTGVWRHHDAMIITSSLCYDVTLRGITAFHKRFPFYMKACMIYMNEVTCYIFMAVSHWCFSIVMSNWLWVIICVTHK